MGLDLRKWTLWGSHAAYANAAVIAITEGTLSHCHAEQRTREGHEGWLLAIYPTGVAPTGLREQAAAQQAAPVSV